MKNQNDLIVIIVAIVVLIGAFCGTYFTMPQVVKPQSPEPVNLAAPQKPTGVEPVMASALPGAGGAGGGGALAGGGPMPGGGGPMPGGGGGKAGPQAIGGVGGH